MKKINASKGGLIPFLTFLLLACDITFVEDYKNPRYDRTLTLLVISNNSLDENAKEIISEITHISDSMPMNIAILWENRDGTSLRYKSQDGNYAQEIINESVSTHEDGLSNTLKLIKRKFPSSETGILLWSHGTGWLPSGKTSRSFGDIRGESIEIKQLACTCMIISSLMRVSWEVSKFYGT